MVKNANGSYSYTPAANFNGTDSFTYTVTDGALTSNLATAHITVAAVNDAPTLGNQSLSLSEDGTLTGNLLASAADIDSTQLTFMSPGDTPDHESYSTFTAAFIASPAHGALRINADGTFDYTPEANFFGTLVLTA